MSIDYIEIGPTPCEEQCASVGEDDFRKQNAIECAIFINQLERTHPIPTGVDVKYTTRSNRHEFGVYREVAVAFDQSCRVAMNFAYDVENHIPASWDEQAKADLLVAGYRHLQESVN